MIRKAAIEPNAAGEFEPLLTARGTATERLKPGALAALLGDHAVHQGIALQVAPLEPLGLEALLDAPAGRRLAVILDQVTDPHNVGAIIRSAAAFGAAAVILQDRHAPPLTATLARAASGAVDLVPVIRVVNLARTLEEMADAGFTTVGLADEAAQPLESMDVSGDVALVAGAEGEGLRRLTRERCAFLAALPTTPDMPSLNVSNAVAVALYAIRQKNR